MTHAGHVGSTTLGARGYSGSDTRGVRVVLPLGRALTHAGHRGHTRCQGVAGGQTPSISGGRKGSNTKYVRGSQGVKHQVLLPQLDLRHLGSGRESETPPGLGLRVVLNLRTTTSQNALRFRGGQSRSKGNAPGLATPPGVGEGVESHPGHPAPCRMTGVTLHSGPGRESETSPGLGFRS